MIQRDRLLKEWDGKLMSYIDVFLFANFIAGPIIDFTDRNIRQPWGITMKMDSIRRRRRCNLVSKKPRACRKATASLARHKVPVQT